MRRITQIYEMLVKIEQQNQDGVTAAELSEKLKIDRTNTSRYLNQLYNEGKIQKSNGRPVFYRTKSSCPTHNTVVNNEYSLDMIVGANQSLSIPIQKAKAAVLYPPKGLHTLLLGETGVGKSMFAEMMYKFAKESLTIEDDAPFIRYNCADYADNPQLLIGQIFGVKKGAFTGAERDKDGLLKKADGGFLFLDEVHRLSAQGQEMLFTFIDKGYFRPLGETEKVTYVDVRLIAATTEDTHSYLLDTFSRRIPMIIKMPPLRKRSICERYSLVETFINEESSRIGNTIYINRNSLISYLIYECPNNIGQLKSDIQLACAKAFLNYKSSDIRYILITQNDIPNHVRKGLMKIKYYREEIEHVLINKDNILGFSKNEYIDLYNDYEVDNPEDFYNLIERKLESLKSIGIEENEINEILNIDIEAHFQKYIGNISRKFRKNEIIKIVDIEIVEVAEEILGLAQKSFNREFDEKIYYGLALHLKSSIERIRNGEKIYNPKLNFIRVNHEEAFLFAMKIAKLIDNRFDIETPVDEIGYLTMFLTSGSYELDNDQQKKVSVILIMHGNSTASSMADVVNSLIGIDHAISLDMPLNMKPEIMYDMVRNKILDIEQGKGVILLVDMGSLTGFGDMLHEEIGIKIKTIDKVSTPVALEICRKAVMGYDIDQVYSSFKDKNSNFENISNMKENEKNNIIVTACFTGQGSSVKLKEIIQDSLTDYEYVEYVALEISSRSEFIRNLNSLNKKYNIISVISAIDIEVEYIPLFSPIEILDGSGISKIKKLVEEEDMFRKVGKSLNDHMTAIRGEEIVYNTKLLISNIEYSLDVKVPSDVKLGVTLHICFLVDSILNGIETKKFENLKEYKRQHESELSKIKKCMSLIEKIYNIEIGDNELAFILKQVLSNSDTVQ
ncbi:sigma 54-interacting transcriptional regulator [Brassicibacter mesophilus]|uniref:sigma 54-interacting transcriptional regulator n=1 Tax=Brassicibacter mesophilus TaxID=745119 RepID=UPI003D220AF0